MRARTRHELRVAGVAVGALVLCCCVLLALLFAIDQWDAPAWAALLLSPVAGVLGPAVGRTSVRWMP